MTVADPTPPTQRLVPKAHPVSWKMLIITTFAILAISVDAAIEPTVLPENRCWPTPTPVPRWS